VVFSPEYSSIPRVAHFLMVDKFTDTHVLDRVYGPETYLMHLTDRCGFLNCLYRARRIDLDAGKP
jgi:hypothetical protein